MHLKNARLQLFSFSVHGELVEPQKNTFARGSTVKEKILCSAPDVNFF
jgi:hypothetical protein